MKIGVVCPLSFKTLGGIQTQSLLFGRELERQGVDVVFFSPTPATSKLLPKSHVQVGVAANLPNFNGSWSDYTLAFMQSTDLAHVISAQKIDLLHIEAPVIPFINWQLMVASPVPIVATLHSGWEKDSPVEKWLFFIEVLAQQLRTKIVQTIAVSHTALECERYFSDKNTIIIPNVVELTSYQKPHPKPKLLTSKQYNLLFVGRLDQRKGMTELLHALSQIPEHDLQTIKLWVIGDGPLADEVKALAKSLDLQKNLKWLGKQPDEEKIAYLQHCDALVAPSLLGESLGMVLTEAMACGLPIICGNNRGYVETLQRYPAKQLIVNPKDPQALADAITTLKNNPKLAQTLRTWGPKEARRYDLVKVTTQHIALYKKILKKITSAKT